MNGYSRSSSEPSPCHEAASAQPGHETRMNRAVWLQECAGFTGPASNQNEKLHIFCALREKKKKPSARKIENAPQGPMSRSPIRLAATEPHAPAGPKKTPNNGTRTTPG